MHLDFAPLIDDCVPTANPLFQPFAVAGCSVHDVLGVGDDEIGYRLILRAFPRRFVPP